jgi:hypothetical protein
MSRKKLVSKNAGGGVKDLPLRRSYEREALEVRGKHKDKNVVRPMDRMNTEEAMKLATKVKPDDYTIEQWRRACLIDLAESGEDRADREKFLLPIRTPEGRLSFELLAEAERQLYEKKLDVPTEKQREAAARIIDITRGERTVLSEQQEEERQLTKDNPNGMRLSQSHGSRADEIMVALPGYSRTEAVRLAAQEEEQEITLADVESYAKEKGIPADGDAYRSLAMERMIRAQAHGVPVESTVDEEAEMERIAESRGLEVPEMPQVAASEATAEVEEHDAELEKIAKERGYAV